MTNTLIDIYAKVFKQMLPKEGGILLNQVNTAFCQGWVVQAQLATRLVSWFFMWINMNYLLHKRPIEEQKLRKCVSTFLPAQYFEEITGKLWYNQMENLYNL